MTSDSLELPRRNIELKARNPDLAASMEACRALGAEDHGELTQRDTYFEVSRGGLKLREEHPGHPHLIQFERASEPQQRESQYRIIEIDDPGTVVAALAATLGVRVIVAKRRRLFLWRNVRIHLDRVDGLGEFIELEAVAPADSDLIDERELVASLRAALRITDEHLVGLGYAEQLLGETASRETTNERARESEWSAPERVRRYLNRADEFPHRAEGERVLLEAVPAGARRALDLGTGDGRLLALLQRDRPEVLGVGLDFSEVMLVAARERFAGDDRIELVAHDLSGPLPELGHFDVVISSFAIHHLAHERKRSLYREVFDLLGPGGVFANFEHVASSTPRLHAEFFAAIDEPIECEDPSDQLLDVETQLQWLRTIGFDDVDCYWKWREMALLVAVKLTAIGRYSGDRAPLTTLGLSPAVYVSQRDGSRDPTREDPPRAGRVRKAAVAALPR